MTNLVYGQETQIPQDYWQIGSQKNIIWDLTKEDRLPHQDNIEIAGKKVAAIISYELDEDKSLSVDRDIIFPQLRVFNKTNEPDWKKYRAYFRKNISDELAPTISHDQRTIVPEKVDSIEIGGYIKFYFQPVEEIQISKTIFPAMDQRLLVEEWEIKNLSNDSQSLSLANIDFEQSLLGYKGEYRFIVESHAKSQVSLSPNIAYKFTVHYGATLNEESSNDFDPIKAKSSRQAFLKTCQEQLILESPNKILNRLFYFSKIRAAESIFESSMGLVHSPGGGNYYVGIWANDQIEYSGPFFPYLGYQPANQAAYNAYNKFLENIPPKGEHIAYAFEVDGNFPMTHLDRGDAAMIAYGTSQYVLASGDINQAKELWPLIEWSLAYCDSKRNKFGAIASESDEMEGRIETGTANLATSSLYYGGLEQSIHIAKALGKNQLVTQYEKQKIQMENVIEDYFGATLEGLDTYKYYAENKLLRHWICLPLVMGITTRKNETLKALFEKLWTPNGILVEYDPEADIRNTTFWDRATLYALRGALKVGEVEQAFQKIIPYSQKRLLGDHVPYVVEAYPENNMKHLSAESALYCRLFTEGLLGIEPVNFSSFELTPKLPDDWNYFNLRNIHLCGIKANIELRKVGQKIQVHLHAENETIFKDLLENNQTVLIKIK